MPTRLYKPARNVVCDLCWKILLLVLMYRLQMIFFYITEMYYSYFWEKMKLSKMMFFPSKLGQNKQLFSFQHNLLPSKRLLLFPISKRVKLFSKNVYFKVSIQWKFSTRLISNLGQGHALRCSPYIKSCKTVKAANT